MASVFRVEQETDLGIRRCRQQEGDEISLRNFGLLCTTRRYIPENGGIKLHHRGNLRFYGF
jgi:hypothetical protein